MTEPLAYPARFRLWPLLIPFVLGIVLILTSTTRLAPSLWNYDTKRLLELGYLPLLFAFALLYAPLRNASCEQLARISRTNALLLIVFFALGTVSAVYHGQNPTHTAYSLSEVILLWSLVLAVPVMAAVRSMSGALFDRLALSLLLLLGLAVGVQEMAGVLAADSAGLQFNTRVSLQHFAWPRFYNQIQSWTLPVLAAIPALFWRRPLAKALCVLVIGLNWYVLLFTGARGSIISIGLAMAIVLALFPAVRREALTWHLSGLVLGCALYFAAFLVVSDSMKPAAVSESTPSETFQVTEPQRGQDQNSFFQQSLGREIMSSSGRTDLWKVSIEDVRKHPVIGTGPMNYACLGELNVAGHPHNFVLQIAGEWGLPALVCLLGVVLSLSISGFVKLRATAYVDATSNLLPPLLAAGVIAAGGHAMLSGVLTMPASQLTGILTGGWLLGLLVIANPGQPGRKTNSTVNHRLGVGTLIATLTLSLALLAYSVPQVTRHQEHVEQTRPGDRLIPRFWQNGKWCGL